MSQSSWLRLCRSIRRVEIETRLNLDTSLKPPPRPPADSTLHPSSFYSCSLVRPGCTSGVRLCRVQTKTRLGVRVFPPSRHSGNFFQLQSLCSKDYPTHIQNKKSCAPQLARAVVVGRPRCPPLEPTHQTLLADTHPSVEIRATTSIYYIPL